VNIKTMTKADVAKLSFKDRRIFDSKIDAIGTLMKATETIKVARKYHEWRDASRVIDRVLTSYRQKFDVVPNDAVSTLYNWSRVIDVESDRDDKDHEVPQLAARRDAILDALKNARNIIREN